MNEGLKETLIVVGIIFCAIGVITVGIGIKHAIDDYIWEHSDHSRETCYPSTNHYGNLTYTDYICTGGFP